MEDKFIYHFPDDTPATLAEVGGKGLSLIRGSRARLPIPPGFILSVHFFDGWFSQLKVTSEWKEFISSDESTLSHTTTSLKRIARTFSMSDEQKSHLYDALRALGKEGLFAVRSSSPHEDLEGASFAGGYETVLGVRKELLEDAVQTCFLSCLDHRVVVYLRANGLDTTNPQIAIVVQQQIASDISGVGFSLNPVTNNFDDAVFNANWGLGETVVAGITTPDTFVVDKVSMRVREKTIGGKILSRWLGEAGGTVEKKHYRSDDRTLPDTQLIELTVLIKKVEHLYGVPIDIEWAYWGEKLYLLQARPITTYIPLPPEMITEPGAKKRLYFDLSITAEGMTRPISYMGTSSFHGVVRAIGNILFLRDINLDIDRAIAHVSDGRLHINVSTFFRLVGKKRFSDILNNIDQLSKSIVDALDETTYTPAISRLRLLPYGLLMRLPALVLYVAFAKRNPQWAHRHINKYITRFEQEARTLIASGMPLHKIGDALTPKLFGWVFQRLIPLVIASRFALSRLMNAADGHPDKDMLTRSLPHNVTIEMSLALSRVAKLAPHGIIAEELGNQIKNGKAPGEFLAEWSRFMEKYGIRGAEEIDLATPRYREDPKFLLDLMLSVKDSTGETPEEVFERGVHDRKAAFASIHAKLLETNPRAARAFERDYNTLVHFGGLRETHKYYLIYVGAMLRERILTIANIFVEQGRLDSKEQVFDLSLEQLDQARIDDSLDLRELGRNNTVFIKKLARIPRPPAIIDSRGFIPRPPAPIVKAGVQVGVAISSGVVRGRVKVLHTPDEKPFLKGEILVARATDPGWTPLFVNAGGLILEIGGLLQHGALVAREYGLPCVAGIENATNLWKDGDLVEIDGSAGTIRSINT